jgi:hypothetical protein
MSQDSAGAKSWVEKYGRLLGLEDGGRRGDGSGGLEANSDKEIPAMDMTNGGINDAMERIDASLKRFAAKYYGNQSSEEIGKQIEKICRNISEGLELLRKKDEEGLKRNPNAVSGLEDVIIGNGFRPMYMIDDDKPDFASATDLEWTNGNPIWESGIQAAYRFNGLGEMVPSVGVLRSGIDHSGPYGTAFLVAPDLIMTNKHVWNEIQTNHQGRYSEVIVDFQYEVRNRMGKRARVLESIVFLGRGDAKYPKTDVALFSLAGAASFEQTPFDIHAGRWLSLGKKQSVFVIGHPVIPKNRTELQRFLSGTSSVKRLCPGKSIHHHEGAPVYHDASTTDSCSGSVVIPIGRPSRLALAIHFKYGEVDGVNCNWAHPLAEILEEKSESTVFRGTLRDILTQFDASFDNTDL